jgi:hypothetical protein
MEFDKTRVYTALNADELRAGDKVICANNIGHLKHYVTNNGAVLELVDILSEEENSRFLAGKGKVTFALAYLVERKENCTNCIENARGCTAMGNDKLARCWNWKPKTKQKEEMPDLISLGNGQYAEKPNTEHKEEKKYHQFRNTDELIKVWGSRCNEGKGYILNSLDMPHIWIRRKNDPKDKGRLITAFNDDCVEIGEAGSGDVLTMDGLFEIFEFLDGSPCGKEYY